MKKYSLIILVYVITCSAFAQNKIELVDLIKKFTPNQSMDYNMYDWSTGAENDSKITWITEGIEWSEYLNSYIREANVIITVDGESIYCLGTTKKPCDWELVLEGARGGYTSFSISSVCHQALSPSSNLKDLLISTDYSHKLIAECEEMATGGYYLYLVKFNNKKSLLLKYSWSCGSAGCGISLDCDFID